MGFQDRDYYRDATRGSGWLSGVAPACKALILINGGVYLAQVVFPEARLVDHFAAYTTAIVERFQLWRLLTANFLHDPNNPFHLIWNMVLLYAIGREVESLYGSREFVAAYLGAGIVSMLGWTLMDAFGLGRLGTMSHALGASGAVMAVAVIYTLYYPRREILLFFVLPVPMWALLGIVLLLDFFFLMQQLNDQGGGSHVGIAFAGHLVGAAYGYAYKTSGIRLTALLDRKRGGGRRPRLRVVKPDLYDREVDVPQPASPARSAAAQSPKVVAGATLTDEQFEAQVDEVLAKIAREGNRSGLTDDEHRILQEASRRARDRRSDRV